VEKWPVSEIMKWVAHFSLRSDEIQESLNPKPKAIQLPPESPPEAYVEIFKGIL
jgi:hypothetical protein